MGRGRSCNTVRVVQGKKFSTRAGRILATPATPVHSIGSKSTQDHPICMAICLTCLPRQRFRSKRRSSSAQLTGMRDFNARTVSEWPVRADWANWGKSYFFKMNTHLLEEKILATDPEAYAFREFGLQIGCLLPATVFDRWSKNAAILGWPRARRDTNARHLGPHATPPYPPQAAGLSNPAGPGIPPRQDQPSQHTSTTPS